MATLLQYRAAALIARLQAAGTGGNRLARTITRIGTPICPGDGPDAHHALRLKPDHPMGLGHAEHAFNEVAAAIGVAVVGVRVLAGGIGWNNGLGSPLSELVAQARCIIG